MHENPYKFAKRGADTFNLIQENRVEFRKHQDGTIEPYNWRWKVTGGRIGWHEAFRWYVTIYLDAGLISHTVPIKPWEWTRVVVTDAGRHLIKRWRDQPFAVVDLVDVPSLIDGAASVLSAAYVEESGLLEDPRDRYVSQLRPHAERVVRDLLTS